MIAERVGNPAQLSDSSANADVRDFLTFVRDMAGQLRANGASADDAAASIEAVAYGRLPSSGWSRQARSGSECSFACAHSKLLRSLHYVLEHIPMADFEQQTFAPWLDDLELLQIEMDLLWGADGGPELVIASARAGQRARVGHGVPEDLARTLIAEVDVGQPGAGLGSPPPNLERWRALLADALGLPISLAPGSGPSYLVQDGVAFRPTAPLVRSDGSDLGGLHNANPGNWGANEWSDLLAGRLGPWVMAVQGDRVISICHTPVFNARAAEAGTWTHPEFRGHGHAAAATAEWATLMRPSGRLLFYSTSHTNYSSQAVAARLGLRSIGWLWQLRRK